MFLVRRPSRQTIERFREESCDLPLSYPHIGIAEGAVAGYDIDETAICLGHGAACFERAKAALARWKHFDFGWVELLPARASIAPGTNVAVLAGHFGFWSLNGCRVVYGLDDGAEHARFGFAYGTLANHSETGEEIFEVSMRGGSDDVMYRIRAVSKPRAALAILGYPLARVLQARFRRDSCAAMQSAVGGQ